MNNMIQLQQNGGSMKFARKIQFLKNMYVDDEDFRDKLANEGIISEDDMIKKIIIALTCKNGKHDPIDNFHDRCYCRRCGEVIKY